MRVRAPESASTSVFNLRQYSSNFMVSETLYTLKNVTEDPRELFF